MAEREALAARLAEMQELQKKRQQPTDPKEKEALSQRYAEMNSEERAYNILLDLGLIELHPDPESDSYDSSNDNDFAESDKYLQEKEFYSTL